MTQKNAKASLVRRTFLSTLIFLFVPVASLFLLLIHSTTREFTDYMKQNEERQIALLEQSLTAEFYNQTEIVRSLIIYQNVRPFYLQRFPASASRLIHNLNNHYTNNNIVDDIYLYFFCDEYFYSTQTSFSTRSFMNQLNLPAGDGEAGAAFLERMRSVMSAENIFYLRDVTPKQSASQKTLNQAILYVIPYEVDNVVVGSVIFQINENHLNAWVGNSPGRDTYIFDASMALMNASDFDGAIVSALSRGWVEQRMRETVRGEKANMTEGNYYILSGAISNTGLYYIRFVENDTLFSALQDIQRSYLLLLLVLLAFGTATLVFVSRPLRKLQQAIPPEGGESGSALSIVDTFLDSYNDLMNVNRQIRDEADNRARESFLYSLLSDGLESGEDIGERGRRLGVELCAPYHFVVIGKEPYDSEAAVREAFPFSHHFAYLLSVRDSAGLNSWIIGSECFFSRQRLQKCTVGLSLSFGGVRSGCAQIHESYVEARSYWDISDTPRPYYKQLQLSMETYQDQMQRAVRQLDSQEIGSFRDTVQSMNEQMSVQGLPQNIQCQIWAKLILVVDQSLKSCQTDDCATPLDVVFGDEPQALYERLAYQTTLLLEQQEKNRRPAPPPLTLDAVLQFIQENYESGDFSLQLTADHFGISLSYLSLFFKERHGDNLLGYYTALRMDKARELLDTTDRPLKEIVTAVGYSNISSFIRRFKQLYGMTPGEYKKQANQP